MGAGFLRHVCRAVQDVVQVAGSSTVNSYSRISGLTRRKRSTRTASRLAPRANCDSPYLKFLVSTTRVSPSPASARFASVLTKHSERAVADRNQPRGAEHLDEHHQVVLGQKQLHVVVVRKRKDRLAERHQAAVAEAEVLDLLERIGPERPCREHRSVLGPWRPRGQPTVRGVGDKRRTPICHGVGSPIEEDSRVDGVARNGGSLSVVYARLPLRLLTREGCRLLLRQHRLVGPLLRTLEWRDAPGSPKTPPRSGAPLAVRGTSSDV